MNMLRNVESFETTTRAALALFACRVSSLSLSPSLAGDQDGDIHVLVPQDQNIQFFFSACALLLRNSPETMEMVRSSSFSALSVQYLDYRATKFRRREM